MKEIDLILEPAKDRREFLARIFNTGAWALVGSGGLLGPLVNVMAAVPAELIKGRNIYSFKGDVRVNGKAITKDNLKTFVIDENSTVVTGANSRIIFRVARDAHFLRSNSQMTLIGSGGVEKSMRLKSGKLLSVFAKRPLNQSLYEIRTPSAIVGIHGTGLYAEAEPELKRSYICTCYGEVKISAVVDNSVSEEIKTSHHDDPRYIYEDDASGGLIQPAPLKNHTDEELQLIETIVGRTTPFSSVKEGYPRPRRGY
jgi:hypothetical protein